MTPLKAVYFLNDAPDPLEGREYTVDPFPTYAGILQSESRTVGVEDPRNLSDLQIVDLYKRKFWDRMRCGEMPDGLDFAVFQAGVNVGTGTAAKWLQAIVGVYPDGVIGAMTIDAVHEFTKTPEAKARTISDFLAAQDAYYNKLALAHPEPWVDADGNKRPANTDYIDGWHNRVDKTRAIIEDLDTNGNVSENAGRGFITAHLGLFLVGVVLVAAIFGSVFHGK